MAKDATKDLTRGDPTRLILTLAISMLVSSLMSFVYNTTDGLMVSRFVSADALGSISAASPIYSLIETLAGAVISSFSIYAGQVFGSGDMKRLKKMMANAVYLTAIFALAVTLIGVLFCRRLVLVMNTPPGFVDLATTYYFIIALSHPIASVTWLCAGMFSATGDSKTPLLISLISGGSNVVFNFLFMGIFDMGIAGAALGTLCAITIGSGLYLLFLFTRVRVLLFGKEDAAPSRDIIKTLLVKGVPLGMVSSVITAGAMILQIAINGHGEDVVTGIATANRVVYFIWMIFQSFESALLYFCAQNLGAGHIDRVRQGVRRTMMMNMGFGAVCAVLSILLGKFIYILFVGNNQAIINVAHEYLIRQVIFFPIMVTLCVWRGTLKGLGSTVPAVICSMIELITRAVLCAFFADNLQVLYFAGPIAWGCTSAFLAVLYPIICKREEKRIAAEAFAKAEAEQADERETSTELQTT